MEGRARAEKKRVDLAILQAWHGEAFARQKRMKRLDEYLTTKTRRNQTPDEMLAVFRSIQAGGAAMTIRQVERKERP